MSRFRFRPRSLLLALALAAPGEPATAAGTSPPAPLPVARHEEASASVTRPPGPSRAWAAQATYDEAGGDDLRMNPMSPVTSNSSLDIAQNGDLYIAIEWGPPFTTSEQISVFRSTDHGATWPLWGRLYDSNEIHSYYQPCLHIAEGTQDRLYLACRYFDGAGSDRIRVAYSPLGGASASWTEVDAMSTAGVNYAWPSIHSDASTTAGYTLFVAAQGSGANGDDIHFTRSTTFGSSWAAQYVIAEANTSDRDHRLAQVRYGTSGIVHCTWHTQPQLGEPLDEAVSYRRALNRAAAGLADWQAPVAITADNNGRNEYDPTIAASHGNGTAVLAYRVRNLASVVGDSEARRSSDHGATWPTLMTFPGIYSPELDVWPGLGSFVLMGQRGVDNYGFMTGSNSTPMFWSAHKSLMDGSHLDGFDAPPGHHHATSPAQSDRSAMTWTRRTGFADSVLFDAEWRGDPGNPGIEPGFPAALDGPADRPLAITELDGDPESEIVIGSSLGLVYAFNHDGSILRGFPVITDTIPGAVAVGNLDGGAFPEIAVGTAHGRVLVLHANGSPAAGWPVDLGTGTAAYVSIGPIIAGGQQVIACSGKRLFLLNADGSVAPGFPKTLAGVMHCAAAIGDVDDDGDHELVILQDAFMDAFRGDGSVQSFRFLTGKTFSASPSLADLNLDGDLEIVCATDQGDVYVLNPDGSNLAPWPYVDPSGESIHSVALAHFFASFEPEVVFGVPDGSAMHVHAFNHSKAELAGYPAFMGHSHGPVDPVIDVLDGFPAEVVAADFADSMYAWSNTGGLVSGWPRDMPGGSTPYTLATGDIDQDGNVEVVVGAQWNLFVFDTGSPVYRNASNLTDWWPMFGYNPERQHCLACGAGTVTNVSPPPGRVRFDSPRPNPASGPIGIHFEMPAPGAVRLRVFDPAGRSRFELAREEMSAGPHDLTWDPHAKGGVPMAPGVYFLKLEIVSPSAEETLTRKVVIVS